MTKLKCLACNKDFEVKNDGSLNETMQLGKDCFKKLIDGRNDFSGLGTYDFLKEGIFETAKIIEGIRFSLLDEKYHDDPEYLRIQDDFVKYITEIKNANSTTTFEHFVLLERACKFIPIVINQNNYRVMEEFYSHFGEDVAPDHFRNVFRYSSFRSSQFPDYDKFLAELREIRKQKERSVHDRIGESDYLDKNIRGDNFSYDNDMFNTVFPNPEMSKSLIRSAIGIEFIPDDLTFDFYKKEAFDPDLHQGVALLITAQSSNLERLNSHDILLIACEESRVSELLVSTPFLSSPQIIYEAGVNKFLTKKLGRNPTIEDKFFIGKKFKNDLSVFLKQRNDCFVGYKYSNDGGRVEITSAQNIVESTRSFLKTRNDEFYTKVFATITPELKGDISITEKFGGAFNSIVKKVRDENWRDLSPAIGKLIRSSPALKKNLSVRQGTKVLEKYTPALKELAQAVQTREFDTLTLAPAGIGFLIKEMAESGKENSCVLEIPSDKSQRCKIHLTKTNEKDGFNMAWDTIESVLRGQNRSLNDAIESSRFFVVTNNKKATSSFVFEKEKYDPRMKKVRGLNEDEGVVCSETWRTLDLNQSAYAAPSISKEDIIPRSTDQEKYRANRSGVAHFAASLQTHYMENKWVCCYPPPSSEEYFDESKRAILSQGTGPTCAEVIDEVRKEVFAYLRDEGKIEASED